MTKFFIRYRYKIFFLLLFIFITYIIKKCIVYNNIKYIYIKKYIYKVIIKVINYLFKLLYKKENILSENIKYIEKLIKINEMKKAEEKFNNILLKNIYVSDFFYINLIRLKIFLKKYDDALYFLKKINNNKLYPLTLLYKAEIELLKGNFKKSIIIFNIILNKNFSYIINNICLLKIKNLSFYTKQ